MAKKKDYNVVEIHNKIFTIVEQIHTSGIIKHRKESQDVVSYQLD